MTIRRGRREYVGGTGREVREARVDVVLQRVNEKIGSELNVSPSRIFRYGVNNIFQRTFAYLLGWKTNGEPQKIAVTQGGSVKVAVSGASFEEIDVLEGTATAEWSDTLEFSFVPNRIRFESLDYPYVASLSLDGVTWSEGVYIDEDIPRDFDICAKYIKVMRYGGSNAHYWIIGMR